MWFCKCSIWHIHNFYCICLKMPQIQRNTNLLILEIVKQGKINLKSRLWKLRRYLKIQGQSKLNQIEVLRYCWKRIYRHLFSSWSFLNTFEKLITKSHTDRQSEILRNTISQKRLTPLSPGFPTSLSRQHMLVLLCINYECVWRSLLAIITLPSLYHWKSSYVCWSLISLLCSTLRYLIV